jgi:glycosyltransferase involved in cell wall biosynthesis
MMSTATRNDTGPNVRARRPSLVSVVIPARNARRTLGAQLEALRAQDYAGPWELVVADNGSTDGTADLASAWAHTLPLRVVDASLRRGASFARNRGWRSALGDLMAFCDADDVVSSGWLSRLTEAAEEADLVGGPYEFRRLNAIQGQPWWDGASLPVGLNFLPFMVGGNLAVWVASTRPILKSRMSSSPGVRSSHHCASASRRTLWSTAGIELAGLTMPYTPIGSATSNPTCTGTFGCTACLARGRGGFPSSWARS